MKYHDNGRNRITGRRILSALLVLSMVFTMGSSPIAVAEAADTHRHNESCYEKVLTCPLEEGHIHGEECYGETEAWICGKEEDEGHVHTDKCYSEDGIIVCGLEEHEGHVHGDDCKGIISVLECSLEEGGHQHTDSCYSDMLVCDIDEVPAEEDEDAGQEANTDAAQNSEGDATVQKKSSQGDAAGVKIGSEADVSGGEIGSETDVSGGEAGPGQDSDNKGGNQDGSLDITEEEQIKIDAVNALLAAVPGSEMMKEQLSKYEADREEWYAAVESMKEQMLKACEAYMELDGKLRGHVTGMESLLEQMTILQEIENSYLERPLFCEKEVHIHDEKCYDDEYNLVCELEEHIHKSECYRIPGVSEEDQERIEQVSRLIADMPGYEEIMEQLEACGEDEDAYYETLMTLMSRVMTVYDAYMELEEELRQYVIGAEEMLQLVEAFEAVWETQTLAWYNTDYGYYQHFQINGINNTSYWSWLGRTYPIITWGDTGENVFDALKSEKITNDTAVQDWVGVMVRSTGLGKRPYYRVTQIVNAKMKSKEDAISKFKDARFADNNEFMILFYNEIPPIEVGDEVALSFDYKWWGKNGTFCDLNEQNNPRGLGVMEIINNTNGTKTNDDRIGLRKLGTEDGVVSTNGLITVDLYNYNTKEINEKYRNNMYRYKEQERFSSYFPFFKSSAGVDGNSYADRVIKRFGTLGFGDTVVVDDPTNQTSLGQETEDINAKQPNFMPINKFMSTNDGNKYSTIADSLVNGYPAVKGNSGSLQYLFNDSVRKGTNVDGLFKYNEQTGYYSFNSRENHAEYNEIENKFDLYNATITPNYIQYPFGNFLPFNKIDAANTTRVADIGRDDMSRMAASARKKALDSVEGSVARKQYESLADAMAKFIALMDEEYPGGWDNIKAAQKFNNWTDNIYEEIFASMYNIDYDIPVDFHFGMSMELQFIQPEDGKVTVTNGDNSTEKSDMIYRFAGDDDVWVFVDGKLFLDLSGIHTQVGGEIDFAKGEVRYYPYNSSSASVDFTNPTVVPFSELETEVELIEKKYTEIDGTTTTVRTFKDYTTHTLNFYYLERGSGSSVCRMEFNLPVMPKNSVGVGKTLSRDNDAQKWLGNPDFTFQVLKAGADGKATNELFFKEGTEYRIYNSDFIAIGKGKVGAGGKFTLKAGQYAVFSDVTADKGQFVVRELLNPEVYEQYGEITAEGNSTTIGADNVIIADVTYKGVDSPAQGINSNAEYTRVTFNNKATTTKYGQLDITKKVETEDTSSGSEKSFDIMVELDGEKVPVGTAYSVNGKSRTVTTVGMISLKNGETASITGLLAGTKYRVQETTDSAKDYSVTYVETTQTQNSTIGTDSSNRTYIEGIILPKQTNNDPATAAITVTNQDILTAKISVNIPAKKILVNPDGKEHKYRFKIEAADENGTTLEHGYAEEKEVTFNGQADTLAEATIPFSQIVYQARTLFDAESNPNRDARTFYYKVTETSKSNETTVCDASEYIVSVIISMSADNSLSQSVKIKKIGSAEGENVEEIVFSNRLLHNLTIAKVLEGESGAAAFNFRIKIADKDGLSVKGKIFDTYVGETKKESITFDKNGEANISVEVGKALTIEGLPYGLSWEVTETNAEAYTASYVVGNRVLNEKEIPNAEGRIYARTVTGNQLTDTTDTVTFINSITYELPSTGGPGTFLYTLAGICMMLGASLLYRYMLKERRYRGI